MSRLCTHCVIVALLLAPVLARSTPGSGKGWLTRSGYYLVSVDSRIKPVPVNRMHGWVLRVTTADGEPVEHATFEVAGRMPQHDHGLPTVPRVTESLGNGEYLLQGLRFHMHGDWELTITVTAGERRDTVVIPFSL